MYMSILQTHSIFYVHEQEKSMAFYTQVLELQPRLHVPGMTEFQIGDTCILGLMPESSLSKLFPEDIPHPSKERGAPRAELYLQVEDPWAFHRRALMAGARELSPVQPRNWGHLAGYSMDPDGYILAFAKVLEEPDL